MKHTTTDRREFLKNVATTSGTAVAAPYFWSSSHAQEESKNDRLNVGSIGTSIYTDMYTGKGEQPGGGARAQWPPGR